LHRDRGTNRTILNFLKASSIDLATCQSDARLDQLRRSEEAPNHVSMNGYH
jgi:hypothetical protein